MGTNPFEKSYLEGELMTPQILLIEQSDSQMLCSQLRVISIDCFIKSLTPEKLLPIFNNSNKKSNQAIDIFQNSCIFPIFEKMVKPLYSWNFDFNIFADHLKIIKDTLDLQAAVLEHVSGELFAIFKNQRRTNAKTQIERLFLTYLNIESLSIIGFQNELVSKLLIAQVKKLFGV